MPSGQSDPIRYADITFEPSRKVAVAVIGAGYWGSKHVRVLNSISGVRQIAIVDQQPQVLAHTLSGFPAALGFADIESALPHVDAVVIATPPQTHFELAMIALHHGKHVLVEKPLATSLRDSVSLVAEARRVNRLLMVGHTFLHNPAVKELRRRLADGELGPIYYIHSARLNLGLYQSDVNVVWDLAPHDISIMNYLLRSTPTAVNAWGASFACGDVEDVAYIRLDYGELGVSGYCHLSWLDPRKLRTVTVVGRQKMAVYDDLADERLRIYDRGIAGLNGKSPVYERPINYRYGDIISPHIQAAEPLALEDQYFVDTVRSGDVPETAGWHGMAVVATLEAVDRSMRTGSVVPVEYPPDVELARCQNEHHWIGN